MFHSGPGLPQALRNDLAAPPGLDLDGRPSSGRNAQVAYADVPAWRARTLSYVPGRNARLLLAPGAELPRAPGCAAR